MILPQKISLPNSMLSREQLITLEFLFSLELVLMSRLTNVYLLTYSIKYLLIACCCQIVLKFKDAAKTKKNLSALWGMHSKGGRAGCSWVVDKGGIDKTTKLIH